MGIAIVKMMGICPVKIKDRISDLTSPFCVCYNFSHD